MIVKLSDILITPDRLAEIPTSVEIIGITACSVYVLCDVSGWTYSECFKWNGKGYFSSGCYITILGIVFFRFTVKYRLHQSVKIVKLPDTELLYATEII